MDWMLLAVLAAATLLALLRGAGASGPGRVDFGWLAIALVIFALAFLPVLWRLQAAT